MTSGGEIESAWRRLERGDHDADEILRGGGRHVAGGVIQTGIFRFGPNRAESALLKFLP